MLVIARPPLFRTKATTLEARALLAKMGHGVWVGPDIRVRVLKIVDGMVHIGIDAPPDVPIRRDELTPQGVPHDR